MHYVQNVKCSFELLDLKQKVEHDVISGCINLSSYSDVRIVQRHEYSTNKLIFFHMNYHTVCLFVCCHMYDNMLMLSATVEPETLLSRFQVTPAAAVGYHAKTFLL